VRFWRLLIRCSRRPMSGLSFDSLVCKFVWDSSSGSLPFTPPSSAAGRGRRRPIATSRPPTAPAKSWRLVVREVRIARAPAMRRERCYCTVLVMTNYTCMYVVWGFPSDEGKSLSRCCTENSEKLMRVETVRRRAGKGKSEKQA
jgi:hypothetical protein